MNTRAFGSLLFGCVAVWISVGAQKPRNDDAKLVMRDKLRAAEQVLEGLVTNDYKSIRGGAERLQGIAKHRSWNVLATPEFVQFSEEMKRQSQRLAESAAAEDTDAATLAYVQLTLTCVNCHKHVRDVKIAQFHPPKNNPTSLSLLTTEN